MRSNTHSISRGSAFAEKAAEPRLSLVSKTGLASVEPKSMPAEVSPDVRRLDVRLDALERLARLRAQNLLTAEEYASEKALFLGHSEDAPGIRHVQTMAATERGIRQDQSLLGRMLSWKFLPIGVVAGIALSFGIQPQETIRFLDQALRLVAV